MMPESVRLMPSVVASEALASVKPASFVAAIVSVPPPPTTEPLPVQPETSNVLLLGPPVRPAEAMPESDMLIPSLATIEALARVTLASLVETIESVPPPPEIEPVPLQPLTLNVLLLGPPARLAEATAERVRLMPSVVERPP